MATVTRTFIASDGNTLTAAIWNAEFNNLLNNLSLVNSDISASAAIAASKLAFGGTNGQLFTSNGSGGISYLTDNGWILDSNTWTYASQFTFTVTGNLTSIYTKGTRLQWTQLSTVAYGTVLSSSYSSPNTTVTLMPSTTLYLSNNTITANYYSYQACPPGYPGVFTTVVSGWTGFSANPASAIYYSTLGNQIFMIVRSGVGTSNSTTFVMTLPVASQVTDYHFLGTGEDNGGYVANCSPAYLTGSTLTVFKTTDQADNAWTASGSKGWSGTIMYQY